MRTAIGYLVLLPTVLWAFRNPRWALFGMVACDHIRPQDGKITFGFESVPFSISYFGAGILLLVLYYKRYRLTMDRFHIAILVMFLAVVNSALFAPCWMPTVKEIDCYFKMFLQYYFICAFIRDEKAMRELYWVIGLAICVVAIRFTYGKFVIGEYNYEGATGDRNEMAMLCVMAFPFILVLGLTSPKRWVKLVAFGLLAPLGACTLFSGSRGGMLGLGAVGFYMLYRLHHKRWLIGLAVIFLAVGANFIPPEIVARFSTIGTATKKDASAIGRINAWAAARNMLSDRPLSGTGTGNFLVYFKRYAPDPNDIHVAHSSFYQLMGEQGLPGLLTWLFLVVMGWVTCTWLEMRVVRLERGRWTEMRYMLLVVKGSWLGYVLCGLFLSQEDMDFFYHLVAIVSRYEVFVSARESARRLEAKNAEAAAAAAAAAAREPAYAYAAAG